MSDYILFCIEYANFEPRVLLVPVDKSSLSDSLKKNVDILRKCSKKYKTENCEIIDNVTFQNITTVSKYRGSYDNYIFSQFTSSLMHYAERGIYDGYLNMDDKIWDFTSRSISL